MLKETLNVRRSLLKETLKAVQWWRQEAEDQGNLPRWYHVRYRKDSQLARRTGYPPEKPLASINTSSLLSYGADLRNGVLWMFVALALDTLHWSANALWFGIEIALFHSAGAIIQHYALRLILYANGSIPFRYGTFLTTAVECKLLRRQGNAYLFTHKLLQDYVANSPSGAKLMAGNRY
jgi:hypothetical protein